VRRSYVFTSFIFYHLDTVASVLPGGQFIKFDWNHIQVLLFGRTHFINWKKNEVTFISVESATKTVIQLTNRVKRTL